MSGFSLSGSGLSITDANSSTWANLPAASNVYVGQTVYVSNAGAKGSFWYSDGTRWKPINGQCLLASLDTPSAAIGSTETITLQWLIPAGMWQVGDIIRSQAFLTKSGATDTAIGAVRVGTSGTTTDTGLISLTWMAASGRTTDYFQDFRLDSATSTQLVSTGPGYGATTSVVASPVAISSASANALYISQSFRSSGATDTVTAYSGSIWLISKAN